MMARKAVLKVVTPPTVQDIIKTLNDNFLQCRDFGHQWVGYSVRVEKRRQLFHETLRCAMCNTRKNRLVTRTGEVTRTTYTYPEGYLFKEYGPFTKIDREAIRITVIDNFLRGKMPEEFMIKGDKA